MLKLFKFLIVSLFICFSSLYANEQKAIDPVLVSGEYISAKAHYSSADYDTSYQLFQKLFLKHSDHVYINYYLAMSAVELKKYDEATAAFERILIMKPDFHRARLEFAKVLYIIGFKQQAKSEFLRVLNSNVPQKVKDNIKVFIASMGDEDLFGLYATFMVGWQFTDNANNGLDQTEYQLPGLLNLTVNGDKPISDNGDVEFVGLDFVNKFKDSSLVLKNKFMVYNKNNKDYDAGDVVFYSYQPSLISYNPSEKTQYALELAFDKVDPGKNKNDEFTAISVMPKYTLGISPVFLISPYLKFQRISYDRSVSDDRDYKKKEVGIDIYYEKFYGGLQFSKDDSLRGTRTDIKKSIIEANIGYVHSFTKSLMLNSEYVFSKIDYNDMDLFFRTKRDDKKHELKLGLTKLFDQNNLINLSLSSAYNRSNQDAYDYDKNSATISYIRKFQW